MDRPLNVFLIKLFCFSSDFNETWWNCSTHRVLQHHIVFSNSEKNKKVLYTITHLTDGPLVKGRWIRPKSSAFSSCTYQWNHSQWNILFHHRYLSISNQKDVQKWHICFSLCNISLLSIDISLEPKNSITTQ